MENKKFKFEKVSKDKEKKIDFRGLEITVKTFMGTDEEIEIIKSYVDIYFNREETTIGFCSYDYVGAEYGLMFKIIEVFSDVSIYDEKAKKPLVDTNEEYFRDLFLTIKRNIVGYDDFKNRLYRTVKDVKEQIEMSKSVGSVLDKIANELTGFLGNLSELDLSEDGLKKLAKSASELSETVSSSNLKGLMDEPKNKKASNLKKE